MRGVSGRACRSSFRHSPLNMDITITLGKMLEALTAFVIWAKTTYVIFAGASMSVFEIAVTSVCVGLVIEAFIPWSGEDEDEEEL